MNVETGAEPLGKTQVGFVPTSHAPYLLARSWRLADFIALMKPRVMALAVFTAMVGMVAAPARIDPLLSIVAVLAIAAGAGASGVLNMWYDADIDVVMARTAMRPIPRGSISRAGEQGHDGGRASPVWSSVARFQGIPPYCGGPELFVGGTLRSRVELRTWVPVEVPRLSGSTSSEDRKNDGIASHVSVPAPHRASLPAA